ncbi:LytR/AlgR family response regulator transcription factor [Enterococcus sp. DIV0756]|uniref:LytR/AlgR family response regulator transcription factor n=1 Tax=Enterococcus sp. DIV0756 TaxID=2774636 RepID=UPI003F1E5F6E
MNIAICDDDKLFCQQMKKNIDHFFIDKNNNYVSEIFLSGEELLTHLRKKKKSIQLYFLDIEMEGIDGISVAKKIREEDVDALIIFITCHEEKMPKAFDVFAFHYLMKPIDQKSVFNILNSAYNYLERKMTIFQFAIRKQIYTLPFSQIEYFESAGRKIRVHSKNNVIYEYYDVLDRVENQISSELFVRIHKSYLINLDYLHKIESKKVIMRSNASFPISRKYQKHFHHKFRKFHLRYEIVSFSSGDNHV